MPQRAVAIGCDRSPPLVDICAQRGFEVLVADAVQAPFRSGCADVALSVAVLHHLSTHARRVAACAELLRVVRADGGAVFLQAWAQEQGEGSRRSFLSQDVFVPWCLARKFASGTDAEVEAAGGVIDPARGAVVFQRFCHVYRRGELEELLAEAAAGLGITVVGGAAQEQPAVGADQELHGGVSGFRARSPVAVLRFEAAWYDKDNWCVIARRHVE